MPILKDRLEFAFCLCLVPLLSMMLPGCGDESGTDFQSYQELQESDRSGENELPDGDVEPETVSNPPVMEEPILEAPEVAASPPTETSESTNDETESQTPPSVAPQVVGQSPESSAPDSTQNADEQPLEPELVEDEASGLQEDLPLGEPNLQAISDGPIEPREIKLLIPEKSFAPEGSEGVLRVSYDDVNLLDILNMDPVPPDAVDHFPNWLAELAGKRIRIRGFMFPPFQSTGLPMFVLVRDNQECCFGPGAKTYDHILVNMREGETTDYIQGRAFDVEGVFEFEPEADGDELYQLYILNDAVVIEK